MWAIIKKELKTYFLSPIGYVVIGILLLVFSLFFWLTTIQSGSVDLSSLYYYVALYGLIIAVPMLTMRMFSEERKNGTEQLLLTSPISITKVVLGKLIASLGVIIITLLISFGYFGLVSLFGKASIMSVLTAMLGFILVSVAALSVGMFASSITENQVISAIVTVAFLVLTLFIENISSSLSSLSIMSFYEKFPVGVISLKEIAGLVSFSIVFIALTILVMQRRKSVK
mgnify:FL=1